MVVGWEKEVFEKLAKQIFTRDELGSTLPRTNEQGSHKEDQILKQGFPNSCSVYGLLLLNFVLWSNLLNLLTVFNFNLFHDAINDLLSYTE